MGKAGVGDAESGLNPESSRQNSKVVLKKKHLQEYIGQFQCKYLDYGFKCKLKAIVSPIEQAHSSKN